MNGSSAAVSMHCAANEVHLSLLMMHSDVLCANRGEIFRRKWSISTGASKRRSWLPIPTHINCYKIQCSLHMSTVHRQKAQVCFECTRYCHWSKAFARLSHCALNSCECHWLPVHKHLVQELLELHVNTGRGLAAWWKLATMRRADYLHRLLNEFHFRLAVGVFARWAMRFEQAQ